MSTPKQRAIELYNHHIALASTDGRLFRKTVMDELMSETGCTLAAAATHYNTAKKAAPVTGLGRAPSANSATRKPGKAKAEELQDDNECFSILELKKVGEDNYNVGRCRSFLLQGDASEAFDEKAELNPVHTWVMIKGLGPLSGTAFKLSEGESEIKRYTPAVEAVVTEDDTRDVVGFVEQGGVDL